MGEKNRTSYPFVWFDRTGWWFKAFDECFGPYARPAEARHNLLVIQGLSRQLQHELQRRSLVV